MAVGSYRILTRIALHVDGVSVTYDADTVQTLDDTDLHLVDRGLAIAEAPPPDPPA